MGGVREPPAGQGLAPLPGPAAPAWPPLPGPAAPAWPPLPGPAAPPGRRCRAPRRRLPGQRHRGPAVAAGPCAACLPHAAGPRSRRACPSASRPCGGGMAAAPWPRRVCLSLPACGRGPADSGPPRRACGRDGPAARHRAHRDGGHWWRLPPRGLVAGTAPTAARAMRRPQAAVRLAWPTGLLPAPRRQQRDRSTPDEGRVPGEPCAPLRHRSLPASRPPGCGPVCGGR